MNKPQYLAELRLLLVFMTAADRDRTVARCAELFDQAGPDGTDGLIAAIGSPTRVSIRLSRTYAPGSLDLSSLDVQVPPAAVPEAAEEDAAASEVVEGLPDLDVPPLVMDDLAGFAAMDDEPPEPPAEDEDAENASDGSRFVSVPPETFEEPEADDGYGPEADIRRVMPLWAGVPLLILGEAAVGVPLALVCLALLPVLLLPGLALLLGTYIAAVGGLWCTGYIADAMMLFGLAFLILSAALLALWCGLRLDAGLVSLYVRGCRAFGRLTLGRKVGYDA